MPVNFDRFRYLNGSGKDTERVEYAGYSDLGGTNQTLPTQTPVPPVLASGHVVDLPNPPTQVDSVRILDLTIDNAQMAGAGGWLLPAPATGSPVTVNLTVTLTSTPGHYEATALFLDGQGNVLRAYRTMLPRP